MRLSLLATGIFLAASAAASAATVPDSGALSFDVFRKGDDIGEQLYSFQQLGDSLDVEVSTDIAVKLPLININAYHFAHNSIETWDGGKLMTIQSSTDDDGTPHELNSAGKDLLPASLWNNDIVKQDELLNTIDGNVMKVSVLDLGDESVPTHDGTITARHYKISGGLDRDLWYDAAGNLAHVSFTADDGSTVTYVRK